MNLKFNHQWNQFGDFMVCRTTPAIQTGYSVDMLYVQTRGWPEIKALCEKENEHRLIYELYDLPRGQYFAALHELLKACDPRNYDEFNAAANRLTQLARQLPNNQPTNEKVKT
jgi:hypothetical protein